MNRQDWEIARKLEVFQEEFVIKCAAWLRVNRAQSSVEERRICYYEIEMLKRDIDCLVYLWRRGKDWRGKHEWAQVGGRISTASFKVGRLMQVLQEEYRRFLFDNQEEIYTHRKDPGSKNLYGYRDLRVDFYNNPERVLREQLWHKVPIHKIHNPR